MSVAVYINRLRGLCKVPADDRKVKC